MSRRHFIERRCDCLVCFGFRLAAFTLLAGIAALVLLAALIHADDPEPLLVDPLQAVEPAIGTARHAGVLRDLSAEGLAEIEPPARYQGDAAAPVIFSAHAVQQLCGDALLACVLVDDGGGRLLVIPNPCPLARREIYAAILCHELGHVNGWVGDHGD